MNNKVYNILIQIQNKKGYTIYLYNSYAYTLKEAINTGKQELFEYYTNNRPKFSKISFDDYMKKINCSFFIYVISGNRLRFNSFKELKDYFNANIKNITNDQLYDFLLSLIDHIYYAYDYTGNLIDVIGFLPNFNETVAYDIAFTEEDCNLGKYRFRLID